MSTLTGPAPTAVAPAVGWIRAGPSSGASRPPMRASPPRGPRPPPPAPRLVWL